MSTITRLLAPILVFAGLAACSDLPTLPPASNVIAANSFNDPTTNYIVGPGDSLDVDVWHNPDLTREIKVQPDGRMSMPLIGDITAAGKTPDALSAEIETKLKPFVKDPYVTVIPTQFVGLFTRQVRVIGEAQQPRAIPYRASMTVLDVLIEVGGLTKYADGDSAVLVRQVNGAQQSYRLELDSLVKDGDISKNVAMQPGDVLIIPQRFF